MPGRLYTRTESAHAKQIIIRCSKNDRDKVAKARDAGMRGSGPVAKNLKGTQFHVRKIDFMKSLSELM